MMGEAKWKREHGQQPSVSDITAVVVVIDRPTAARITDEDINSLGGAWVEMFEAWKRLEIFPYLVMMAHTEERVRKRAPLTAMSVDSDALRLSLKRFCGELSDVKCQWALFVEAGSIAESIVREEMLRDAVEEGHA